MRGPEIAIDRPPDTDRIFTAANIVSMIRLAGIPIFAYVLLGLDEPLIALFILMAIGATDWLDGSIARRYHQITTLGKILDPTIDRLLLFTTVICLMIIDAVPIWLGLILAAREVFIGCAGLVLWRAGAKRISVTYLGKVYSFGLMVTFPLFLLGATDTVFAEPAEVIAWVFVVPCTVLSYYTAYGYAKRSKAALAAGRASR